MNRRVLSRVAVWAVASAVLIGPGGAGLRADSTPQTLPFSQDWSNVNLITTANDWSGVPGIIGYRGDDITTSTGADPRLLLADGTTTPVNVLANQTNPNTLITGGIAEFDTLPNPTVALQGSGTADAPFLLISLNTLGRTGITVSYNVRDVDGSADNTNQQVALHYRVGSSGNFTNVPAAYIADATTGPNLATLVTPVSVVLPADAENQPLVQIRIMTTNAPSNDEWVGIDDISVTGTVSSSTNPSGSGTANPNPALVGGSVLLTVAVTPGTNPSSTGIQVSADLSSIGGSAAQAFHDDGGNSFSFNASIPLGTTSGAKSLPVTISDEQIRTGTTSISLTVNPPPPPVGHPVISQIYGGGGNSGAVFQNDFVELYNPGTTPFDLTGWSVQYASATGSFSASNLQPLAGVISPGEYYLIALASGGANGAELPVLPNVAGSINMSATTGKVALVSNSDPLTGGAPPDCPSTDGDLIDFVGYGGANCREGTANAPAPSNSTALLRNNGGATDTDSNSADFTTGTPNPRRTSPIAEVGPFVQSTDPARNASEAPRDASMTITFSEDVTLDAGWYHIACATTGDHDDATVAGGPRTFVITPNVNFLAGESCTVTLFKDTVHDVDLDDSGPNTDTLAADYVWSFTVATGAAPAYPPEVHLTMGNPSGAVPDVNEPDNYLMSKPEYALSYNRDLGRPNWVSWHLDDTWVGHLTRVDTFRPDPAVPPDWYRVQATDFFGTGFDRGHMTPNADRDNENSIPINQATFLMSNMVAQSPDNNEDWWANLENYLRTLLPANEVYIVSGPSGRGGTGSNGFVETVAGGRVTVPAYTWKAALVLPKDSGDDVSRVSASTRTIAVIMPNRQSIPCVPPVVPPACDPTGPDDWKPFLTSVHDIEVLTGYDLFSNVDPAVQHVIEAVKDGDPRPPGAADQVVATDEDTPKDFTLRAVSASAGPLTYVIDTPPVHGAVTGTDANRTYVPVADFSGTDSFTFHVSDGTLTSNTATVTVQVSEVNDPPVFTSVPGTVTIPEGSPYTFTVQAHDVDSPSLTFSLLGAPAGAAIDPVNGQLSWTPTEAQGGTGVPYAFTVRVSDGSANTDAAVVIDVTEVNTPPGLSLAGHYVVAYGQLLAFTAVGSDTDLPAQPLGYGLSGPVPSGAAIDPGTGAFAWTPGPGQAAASYTFGVFVSDGIASTTVPVTVDVTDPVPPTLALPGPVTAVATSPAGAVVSFTATATDVVDGPRPVTCAPASGSTFAVGTTTVSCSAADTHGNTASGSFTVTVTTATVPGRMVADAAVDLGTVRHDFTFLVQEEAGGGDLGVLVDRVTTRRPGRDQVDLFVSTAVTSVAFFNVPGVSPGPQPPSGVDTVSFAGVGLWNGRGGYGFDAVATDGGEPGRQRDAFRITVRDAAGNVVATVDGGITSGNIQSLHIGH